MTKREFLEYQLTSSSLMFTRYFYKKRFGRKFLVNWHHEKICEILDKVLRGEITRVIFNLPPRYSKTELCVKNFISLGLAINPSSKFIHLSYSDDLAKDNSEEVRELVKSNEYRSIFPFVKVKQDSDSKKKWYTTEGGWVYATSAAGQVTGFGAGAVDDEEDITKFISDNITKFSGAIIIDDPIKPDDALSETIRESVNNRFDSTIRSRVNSRRTPIIIIMQRLHMNDLCGHLIDSEGEEWHVVSLPALYIDEDGKERALWELKHNVDELKMLRNKNEYVFDSQYMQNPMPKEGLLFPQSELNFYDPQRVDLSNATFKIMWADPADTGDDFASAIGYVLDDNVYIDVLTCNNIGLDYNIPLVTGLALERKPSFTGLEGNSGWIQTCNDIRAGIWESNDSLEIQIYKEKANKEQKIAGQAYFIKKRFLFRKDWESHIDYKKAIKRLTTYMKEGTGQKDDVPDVLSNIARYLRRSILHE